MYWQVNHWLAGLGVEANGSCSRDVDCAIDCPGGAFCNNGHTCQCLNSMQKRSEYDKDKKENNLSKNL